jgi:UDP-N-acetylmuramate dehydrogenase
MRAIDIFRKTCAETEFRGEWRENEPMAAHTTIKTGGPAELWVHPAPDCPAAFTPRLLADARSAGVPLLFLGGGSNLLIADSGIPGIVLDMTLGSTATLVLTAGNGHCRVGVPAGMLTNDFCEAAAKEGLSGAEFLAGLPGTIGGAIFMNARCFGGEIADILQSVTYIGGDFGAHTMEVAANRELWGYKRSPFQCRRDIAPLITCATFNLTKQANSVSLFTKMAEYRAERERKGHFKFPCAGSFFKNNRAFGKPTGQIIEELGFCGAREGGAEVAPWHGNIIINSGGAATADILRLAERIKEAARAKLGIELEREVICAP